MDTPQAGQGAGSKSYMGQIAGRINEAPFSRLQAVLCN